MGVTITVIPVPSSVIPVFFLSFPRKRESRERQGGGEYKLNKFLIYSNSKKTRNYRGKYKIKRVKSDTYHKGDYLEAAL